MVTRMSMKVQEMILVDGEEGMSSHQFIACMHVYGLTSSTLSPLTIDHCDQFSFWFDKVQFNIVANSSQYTLFVLVNFL